MSNEIYVLFEILGTLAFAISGAMVAIQKKMDILGVIILGVTTAVGGGVIRDIMMGITPPTGFTQPAFPLIAIIVSVTIFIPRIRKHINLDSKLLILIDAIGLGTFTAIGCKAALSYSNIWFQIFLGVLTGVGGGVLRDIFAAQKPIIFVKHFYALASLSGAIICSLLMQYSENISIISCIFIVVILRVLAAHFKWQLPKS